MGPAEPQNVSSKLEQCLESLDGVYKIADHLLIIGEGDTDKEADQDHDHNLKNLLDSCKTMSIKLNKEKFQFKCSKVSFIGHVMTKEALKPDPRKVEAIIKMDCPNDVPAVQRFIGLVKYLAKFLQDLSEICEPLCCLTHKNA